MVQDKKGCHNLTHLRPQNYIQVLSNEPIPKGGSELPVIKDFQNWTILELLIWTSRNPDTSEGKGSHGS